MKQQVWSSPKTTFEQFVPQNYIAACGDSGATYLFKCDAGGGTTGTVYYETNGVEGLQVPSCHCGNTKHESEYLLFFKQCSTWGQGDDTYRTSSFHACVNDPDTKGVHEASSTSDFINGYYVAGGVTTPVVIWKGTDGDNVHCTTALDINSWEIAKS